MATNQKVRFKIGDAEFEAEGDSDSVSRQFEEFVRLLGGPKGTEATRRGDSEDAPKRPPTTAAAESPVGAKRSSNEAPQPQWLSKSDTNATPEDLHRLFRTEADGTLRLTELPPFKPVESNVFLFVLYGNLALRGEHMITAPSLMTSGRKSGLEIDRADTHLAGDYKKLHVTTGKRRGKRYGISRAGIEYVEKHIRRWESHAGEKQE